MANMSWSEWWILSDPSFKSCLRFVPCALHICSVVRGAWKMLRSFESRPQHDALRQSRAVHVPPKVVIKWIQHAESVQTLRMWTRQTYLWCRPSVKKVLAVHTLSVKQTQSEQKAKHDNWWQSDDNCTSSKLSTGHSVKWGTMGPKSGWFLLREQRHPKKTCNNWTPHFSNWAIDM